MGRCNSSLAWLGWVTYDFPLSFKCTKGLNLCLGILKCSSRFVDVILTWFKLGQVRKIDVAEEKCRQYCTIRVKGVDED